MENREEGKKEGRRREGEKEERRRGEGGEKEGRRRGEGGEKETMAHFCSPAVRCEHTTEKGWVSHISACRSARRDMR